MHQVPSLPFMAFHPSQGSAGGGGTLATVTADHEATSPLDEWIAEVGEEGVLAVIAETRQRIADGTLPSFGDAESLRAYWSERLAGRV